MRYKTARGNPRHFEYFQFTEKKNIFTGKGLKNFRMNTILQLLRQNEIVVVEQVCGLAYSPAFTIINENM